jgi:hypothetical protein
MTYTCGYATWSRAYLYYLFRECYTWRGTLRAIWVLPLWKLYTLLRRASDRSGGR